ncbi:AMP-dependent synthetase and ligase [uncultured Paludibacter sp.]|nr:AMP-dependent synthetase and ligase [uncultured Paludibacter sp.]
MGFKCYLMKEGSIILDGKTYGSKNIELLQKNVLWQQEIYSFLKNWFDDTEVVTLHTSGSTGTPKEIHLSKETMRNSARMTNHFFDLNSTKTALLCLPASYIAGKMMLVRAILGSFNLIITEPKANPFENLKISIDFTAITPYQLQHSIESLKNAEVKNIIVGGGQITPQLEEKISEIPTLMYETYGMTETASHIALRKINGERKSEFFTVLEGVSIRKDENNCLIINAPHLSRNEIHTNDLVEIADEKTFRWLGRMDNVINSGGIKIFPEQIEKKIATLIPFRYFISSLPDESLGNKVVLIIETEKYTETQELVLKEKLQSTLNKYEIPKQIFYIPQFICSASNKILKKETMDLL